MLRLFRVVGVGAPLLCLMSGTTAAQIWRSLGPSPFPTGGPTGRITALAVDPSDSTHWMLGSAGGGVWSSHDAGNSWAPLTDTQPTLATGSVAFAPSNPNVIYVGTGEATYASHAQAGVGILRTSDGGYTWILLGSQVFARTAIGAIRVSQVDPNILVAVMSRAGSGRDGSGYPGSSAGPPPFGVQRSTDGGRTWSLTLAGESTSIEVDPNDFTRQYTAISLPTNYGPYNKPAPAGIYRSTDSGQTWNIVAGPWIGASTGRIVLALAPSNPATLFASVQGPDTHVLGIYRTDNAWDPTPNWTQVATPPVWPIGSASYPDYCGSSCESSDYLAVDPGDPNTLYAGGLSLWRCVNCSVSANWTNIGYDPQGAWSLPRGNRCAAVSVGTLITCTDAGVYKTQTKSGPWTDSNGGLSVTRLISGSLHPTDPNAAIVAAFDNGEALWSGGSGWQFLLGSAGDATFSTSQPGSNLMISGGGRIYRTVTGGPPFRPADSGFDASGLGSRFLAVRKCPSNDDVFVSGVQNIFRTDDFFSGVAGWAPNGPPGDNITAIAFAPSDTACNTYAYGTATGRVFITTDGGGKWSDADSARTLPARAVNSLAFDYTSPKILYAAFSGLDQTTPAGHLFRTSNALSTSAKWAVIGPGVNLPLNVVAPDPGDVNSIYVGADAGVWHTSNGGTAWQFLGPGTGLPNAPVYDIRINAATNRIVAFTFGRGAWSLDWQSPASSGPLLTITADPSLSATLGSAFAQPLAVAGTPPFTWSVAGSLPPGLVLLPTGQISGSPLIPGTYTFILNVTDAALGSAFQTVTLTVAPASNSPVWSNIGPAPLHERLCFDCLLAGRVSSIAVDPADNTHWLVGVGNGGIWETIDGGVNFRPISDSAPTLAIGAIAFAPSNSQVVYAGMGETTGATLTKAGKGLLKSIDAGKTWTILGASTFTGGAFRWIRVNPSNPDIIEVTLTAGGAGRDSQVTAVRPPFGVYRSTDGGQSWSRTLAGYATALEIDPVDFNYQFAAIGSFEPVGNTSGALPNGLYRSTDAGQTWSPVAGPWGVSTISNHTTGRIELAIAPSNHNLLYVSVAAPTVTTTVVPLLGLFRTENAWASSPTWITIPVEATGNGGYCGPGKCNYAHVISVNPSDPDTLYAGGSEQGLWRCSRCTASASWTQQQPYHGDDHALAWAGGRLIAGNDGGVWSTPSGDNPWQVHNQSFSTLMFYGGDLHPTDPDFFIGSLRDNGVPTRNRTPFWTIETSVTTVNVAEVGEAEIALSTSQPDTNWMASWIWGVVARTTDGGKTFVGVDQGIDKTASAFVAPVRRCPANEDVFLTGTNRLWRTENFFSAATPAWTANSPFGSPNLQDSPATIQAIAFAPTDPTCNTYAFGDFGGQVQLTQDGGKTWTNLDPSKQLPSRAINSLAFDPNNPNILWAALSGFDQDPPGTPGHVFRSTNALASQPVWSNVSPPQDQPFDVIAVDPVNTSLVFAGSDAGLWRSNDAGATWILQGIDLGMPPASVYDIKINPTTGRTVAFTYGRSAYALGPELTPNSVVSDPDLGAGALVAGSWALVTGRDLAGVTRAAAESDFAGLDQGESPTKVSGVQAVVNGVPAPINFISPTQIVFMIPAGTRGPVSVQAFRDGVPSNTVAASVVSSSLGEVKQPRSVERGTRPSPGKKRLQRPQAQE